VTNQSKDGRWCRVLDTLEVKSVGIIDNGQANSTTMFQELAAS